MSILSFILNAFKRSNSKELDLFMSVETRVVINDNDDYDKHSSLLKEATSLKKNGEMESSLKKIDEALALASTQAAIYKKAHYLQLNSQFDEAWNVMNEYIEGVNIKLVDEKVDWSEFYSLFLDYVQSHIDLTKLLKREKRTKDVIYYGAISEYLNLLKLLILPMRDNLSFIEKQQNESISKKLKIKSKEYDLNGFDKIYSEFIKSKSKEFENLVRVSEKSTTNYPKDSSAELRKLISHVSTIGNKCFEGSKLTY